MGGEKTWRGEVGEDTSWFGGENARGGEADVDASRLEGESHGVFEVALWLDRFIAGSGESSVEDMS